MRLYVWRGTDATRNFGDELNTLLWPRLLPELLGDKPDALLLGIGSVLDARHDAAVIKVVAGAGYGGYQPLPALDARWIIHWVRGPRTAHLLGLPPLHAIGDPAMLLPLAGWDRSPCGDAVGFMPHFESLVHGAWAPAARQAGVELIDPRAEPEAIIAAIGNCRLLLSEAMHGAIVADALRIPWVALRPLSRVHRAKWHDWAEGLGLRIRFQPLVASSLPELMHVSPLASRRLGRRLLRLVPRDRITHTWFFARAAQHLVRAAAAAPQLSATGALNRCQERMMERLAALRRDPFLGRSNALSLHP